MRFFARFHQRGNIFYSFTKVGEEKAISSLFLSLEIRGFACYDTTFYEDAERQTN